MAHIRLTRVPEELHRRLRADAVMSGVSLEEWCIGRLGGAYEVGVDIFSGSSGGVGSSVGVQRRRGSVGVPGGDAVRVDKEFGSGSHSKTVSSSSVGERCSECLVPKGKVHQKWCKAKEK